MYNVQVAAKARVYFSALLKYLNTRVSCINEATFSKQKILEKRITESNFGNLLLSGTIATGSNQCQYIFITLQSICHKHRLEDC